MPREADKAPGGGESVSALFGEAVLVLITLTS